MEQKENEKIIREINDKELILEFLKRSSLPFECISDGLQKDKGVIRQVLKRHHPTDGRELASDARRIGDKEIALEAVKIFEGFKYLQHEFRKYKEDLQKKSSYIQKKTMNSSHNMLNKAKHEHNQKSSNLDLNNCDNSHIYTNGDTYVE